VIPLILALACTLIAGGVWIAWQLHRRSVGRWLLPYLLQTPKRRAWRRDRDIHLLLCIADHFEPVRGGVSAEAAQERVDYWVREYPRQLAGFRDSDGQPPRHTFFYPLEAYERGHLDALAGLCREGFGEVEVHLHHDRDTADNLRSNLQAYKELLARQHGLLARDRVTGEVAYGFIHGNWALDNSRPDARWCGVTNELGVLRETGCYADFTLPSAPSPAQTHKINSIYYACGNRCLPKAHDTGLDVGSGPAPVDALLLIQGPLLLNWRRLKWGFLPRIENGCLQAGQPPNRERLHLWLDASIQVPTRPDWFFVKLHTHGAWEINRQVLLGDPMIQFHRTLAALAKTNARFHFHYVTAREMFNLVKAAEAGWRRSVADARDFRLLWNGHCSHWPLAV
jgi:hypothetical protein